MSLFRSLFYIFLAGLFLVLAFMAGRLSKDIYAEPAAVNSLSQSQQKNPLACEQSVQQDRVLQKLQTDSKTAAADIINKKILDNKQRNPSAAAMDDQHQLLLELALVDPQAAMAQAHQLTGDRRNQAIAGVLEVWGKNDPDAAWAWVENTDPTAIHQFDQLLEIIGRDNPHMAAGFAGNIAANRPELTQEVYLSALMGIAHSGAYDQARALVESANISTEDRAVLMNFVSGSWATYEPEAAAQWVMSQPADVRANALVGLGESWSEVDPERAANFASTLENGQQRQLMLQQSISKWLMKDAQAATNWLAAAENHQDYDQAIQGLATLPHVVRENTNLALSWSERIYDQNLRVGALQVILDELKRKDPAAAAAYVRSAPNLSVMHRTQLQNSLAN